MPREPHENKFQNRFSSTVRCGSQSSHCNQSHHRGNAQGGHRRRQSERKFAAQGRTQETDQIKQILQTVSQTFEQVGLGKSTMLFVNDLEA